MIFLRSKLVTISPTIIMATPNHCSLDSFSNKTILAVINPVMGTNKDRGAILLRGYLEIKTFQNPYPNSVAPKAR